MNHETILAFLSVVENGSLSLAAQKLYTTQSNITKKLQQLETEMGVPLLHRGRGQRTIELTGYGQEFLDVAKKWNSLWMEFQAVREQPDRIFLSLGCVDLVNTITFVPLYRKLLSDFPSLQLTTHTLHSSEIGQQLSLGSVDLGFAMSKSQLPDIVSTPLYEESMYLLCAKDSGLHDGMSLGELDPSKEIYLRWGTQYEHWHDQQFPGKCYHLRVGTGHMLGYFVDQDQAWAIVPASLAQRLCQNFPLASHTLRDPVPTRICYLQQNSRARESRQKGIEIFLTELSLYLEESTALHSLWKRE